MMKHPRVTIPAVLALSAVLGWAGSSWAFYAGGGKKPENDCLIGYNGIDASDITLEGKKQNKPVLRCQDCDPSCDKDGVNTPNGSCTVNLGVCINQPGVEGCTPAAGLDSAKASAKANGTKGKISVDVPQLLEGSACGGFVNIPVALKKNGTKDGKGTVTLKAKVNKDKTAGTPKRTDSDKLTIICEPLPAGQSCPVLTTTTTTVSTSTTTTTVPPCGNGTVDAGEACDTAANPTGCGEGETCIFNCTCHVCAAPGAGDPSALTFTTGFTTEDEAHCGSTSFFPAPASSPFGGFLGSHNCTCAANSDCGTTGAKCVQGHCTQGEENRIACTSNTDCAASQTCEDSTIDLGLGCLYIGGGTSTVPGGVTPDSAPSTFGVDLVCDGGNFLVLGGGDTGGLDCTLEDGPTKYCANGHPGTGGGACTTDADCRPLCTDGHCVNGAPGPNGDGTCTTSGQCGSGVEGCTDPTPGACNGVDGLVCVPRANCNFGPPLPVRNSFVSTCVQNAFDNNGRGVANISTGETTLGFTLSSRVYLTSLTYPNGPCPTCVAGTCDAGPNVGQPCTGVGTQGTTHDCPPDSFFFLAPLPVSLDPLSTGSSTLPPDGTPSSTGLFCPSQVPGGAFTVRSARSIVMSGTPAAGGLSTTPADATLVSAFCIPRTRSQLIDAAANLPGPGATSLFGTLQLQP